MENKLPDLDITSDECRQQSENPKPVLAALLCRQRQLLASLAREKELETKLAQYQEANFRQAAKINSITGARAEFADRLLKIFGYTMYTEKYEAADIVGEVKALKNSLVASEAKVKELEGKLVDFREKNRIIRCAYCSWTTEPQTADNNRWKDMQDHITTCEKRFTTKGYEFVKKPISRAESAEARESTLRGANEAILNLINEQAEDAGLWFIPKYISEDYLQQTLRKLHKLAEALLTRKGKS